MTRVAAEASLADVREAVERARLTGEDPEWDDLEERASAGEILPLRFHVSVDARDDDGDQFTVERVNEDVWVDRPKHPPEIEESVREIASKDFGELAQDLRERGVDVSSDDLGGMYVTVTLHESLRTLVFEGAAAATA